MTAAPRSARATPSDSPPSPAGASQNHGFVPERPLENASPSPLVIAGRFVVLENKRVPTGRIDVRRDGDDRYIVPLADGRLLHGVLNNHFGTARERHANPMSRNRLRSLFSVGSRCARLRTAAHSSRPRPVIASTEC